MRTFLTYRLKALPQVLCHFLPVILNPPPILPYLRGIHYGSCFPALKTSVRDNRLNLQPTVNTVILNEERSIALRTGENHGRVFLETHLATQNNNAGDINTERNCFHHRRADPANERVQKVVVIPSALTRPVA